MRNWIIVAAAWMLFSACRGIVGSGNIVTEKRAVKEFTAIEAGGAYPVEVTIGSPAKVEVEADDNVLRFIKTTVSNGELNIHTQSGVQFTNAHFKVYITVPELERVKASGAAEIKIISTIKNSGHLKFMASGAANIQATADAPQVQAECSGAGQITLNGRTRDLKAEASGSGDIKASGLLSENTDAHVSGAGTCYVFASVTLKAAASGAGTIRYKGGARVDQQVSGAGTVRKEDIQ